MHKINSLVSPRVFIIIINYNGFEDTYECINSLNNIKYVNYKIIIVDNNSNNESYEKLKKLTKKFNNCILLRSENNNGFASACNIGINYAIKNNCDYVLLLNNDTIVDKDFLKILVNKCLEYDNKIIATCKIVNYYKRDIVWYGGGYFSKLKGNVYHFKGNINDKKFNIDRFVTFASGCCLLIPLEIIKKIGLLDESYFLYYEDADYSCKVIKNNYDILYCSKSIIYHKISHTTGKIEGLNQYYYYRNRCIFISKNISNPIIRIIAFFYYYATILLRIFKTRKFNNLIYKGIIDYYKKIIGKTEFVNME